VIRRQLSFKGGGATRPTFLRENPTIEPRRQRQDQRSKMEEVVPKMESRRYSFAG